MSVLVAIFGDAFGEKVSPTPLYIRLQDRLRAAIRSGTLKPQDALPGERDLAEALGVSRVTVRKALGGLIDEGLLTQRQGSGTFVAQAPRRVEQALSRLTSFSDDMKSRGLNPAVKVLEREISLPSPEEAMRLSISPGDKVSRLKRLRLADDVPMAIEQATIPGRFLPDPFLVETSLYDVLARNNALPVRALQRISATTLGPAEANLLETAVGSAALAIDRLSFLDNGTPVEFTRSFYRGDAYDFVAELTLRRE
jgi:GntR family transcriptional regulator